LSPPVSFVFALEIDGRPTLAFEASDTTEASEICADPDLRLDLLALTSDGLPICALEASLTSRPATVEEIASFQRAVALAPPSQQPTMAFLIKVDGVTVVALDAGASPSFGA
jgi:hypothetical protein